MIGWVLAIVMAIQTPQEPFTQFTYCREFPGSGAYERQCVQLKPDGAGNSRIKQRDREETASPFNLSPAARDKLLARIKATRNLSDRDKYESKKKVANLGRKHLVLELASEKRETEFNFSELKEVNALLTFLDGLLNQQTIVADLVLAAQHERLSIPEKLDLLERELKVGRIGDPQGLIPSLDKIIQDQRILAYAREHAQQLKVLVSR